MWTAATTSVRMEELARWASNHMFNISLLFENTALPGNWIGIFLRSSPASVFLVPGVIQRLPVHLPARVCGSALRGPEEPLRQRSVSKRRPLSRRAWQLHVRVPAGLHWDDLRGEWWTRILRCRHCLVGESTPLMSVFFLSPGPEWPLQPKPMSQTGPVPRPDGRFLLQLPRQLRRQNLLWA